VYYVCLEDDYIVTVCSLHDGLIVCVYSHDICLLLVNHFRQYSITYEMLLHIYYYMNIVYNDSVIFVLIRFVSGVLYMIMMCYIPFQIVM